MAMLLVQDQAEAALPERPSAAEAVQGAAKARLPQGERVAGLSVARPATRRTARPDQRLFQPWPGRTIYSGTQERRIVAVLQGL